MRDILVTSTKSISEVQIHRLIRINDTDAVTLIIQFICTVGYGRHQSMIQLSQTLYAECSIHLFSSVSVRLGRSFGSFPSSPYTFEKKCPFERQVIFGDRKILESAKSWQTERMFKICDGFTGQMFLD